MRIIKLLNTILFFAITIQSIYCQTADVIKGCIPLNVNFTPPSALAKYYWDFKDGGTANSQNPQHIFTRAGTYQVDLFEGQGGRLVGSVSIKVFAEPEIKFTASNLSGCSPLTTQFSSQITTDPEIIITSVLWAFGDGNSSIQRNPTHTYSNAGSYHVSLSITTNYKECDKTFLIDNYILVQGVVANFTVSTPVNCDAPATLSITNLSKQDSDFTYSWDFGNGTNFNGFDPKTVTYLSKGGYIITLKVKDKFGCESTISSAVSVGPPAFVFNFNDSICWPNVVRFLNNSSAKIYQWEFGTNGIPQTSSNKSPVVRFTKPGSQNIKVTAVSGKCISDTTFTIFLEQVDTNFTIAGPDCLKDPTISLTANNKPNYKYTWNDSIQDDYNYDYKYKSPLRDSFYRHRRDTIYQKLVIKTELGCTDSARKYFVHLRPNAIVQPSRHEGCAPLTVNFSDISTSIDPITRWTLIYGDGQSKVFTNKQLGDYTFTKPGVYFVKLIIENSKNCIDTSEGFFIKVGDKLNPGFKVDKTEICLGESITVTKINTDSRIDTWHVNSDNGRFSHCWKNDTVTYRFIHSPGIFALSVTGEYNGCAMESSEIQMIKVKGAKPNMHFMVNCNDSNRVMFTHNSIGSNKIRWQLGDTTNSNLDSFIHRYKNAGTYKVILTAEDSTSGCPALMDMRTVHVKNIKADLVMEDTTCAGVELVLDGRNSQDVDRDCYSGFLWKLPDARPRSNAKDTIHKIFGSPGLQEVTLVTIDINGCRDSMTKPIFVSLIDADFELDKSNICFPADIQFTDKTNSNNKIISWNWSFGDTSQNPKKRFNKGDRRLITLIVTNELNCSDTALQNIRTYTPTSKIEYNKGPGLCLGDSVQFFATDFTTEGSHLNFNWDFGKFGKSNLQDPKVYFDTKGRYKVVLNYVEDTSGCTGSDSLDFVIVGPPVAKFSVPLDSPLCYPFQFKFINESIVDSLVNYFWEFEKGKIFSNLKNPVYTYGKGTHTTKLIVQSVFGCSDTTSQTFTLIGPEGRISVTKPFACKGEPITFNALDLVDVASIQWEFNDGKPAIKDKQTVEHVFDKYGKQTVVLILKSSQSGCEFIDSLTINVPFVKADFENLDTVSYCPGLVVLRNLSQPLDSNSYSWNFGDDKAIDTTLHPITKYKTLGVKNITLTAIHRTTGCKDIFTDTVQLDDVTDFLTFPNVFSPNNDGVNDYFTVAVKKQFNDFVTVKTLKVYNRWGKLLYDNENPSIGWDGKIDGVEAPVEVYAYYMEVEIKDCNNKSRKGNVTIVR